MKNKIREVCSKQRRGRKGYHRHFRKVDALLDFKGDLDKALEITPAVMAENKPDRHHQRAYDAMMAKYRFSIRRRRG